MKLRHKQSGVVLEGPYERKGDSYVDVTMEWGERTLYHHNEWERVPEERWVKVDDLRVVTVFGGVSYIERKESH
jgi:hypothetical protein